MPSCTASTSITRSPWACRSARPLRSATPCGRRASSFQFGTQQRSDLKFRWACELALNGRLGKLKEIHVSVPGGKRGELLPDQPVPDYVDWDRWVGPAPQTGFNEKKLERDNHENINNFSLGMISCWGIHHLDIAQWGNGTDATGPSTIEGTGEFPTEGTFDTIERWKVRFEFAKAAPVTFVNDGTEGFKHGIRFVGETGWVHVDRGTITAHDEQFLRDPQNKYDTMPIALPISLDHVRNFVDAVKSGNAGDLRHRDGRPRRHAVPARPDRGQAGPQAPLGPARPSGSSTTRPPTRCSSPGPSAARGSCRRSDDSRVGLAPPKPCGRSGGASPTLRNVVDCRLSWGVCCAGVTRESPDAARKTDPHVLRRSLRHSGVGLRPPTMDFACTLRNGALSSSSPPPRRSRPARSARSRRSCTTRMRQLASQLQCTIRPHPKLKMKLFKDREEFRRCNRSCGWAEAFYRTPYCYQYYGADEAHPYHWMMHEATHQLNAEAACLHAAAVAQRGACLLSLDQPDHRRRASSGRDRHEHLSRLVARFADVVGRLGAGQEDGTHHPSASDPVGAGRPGHRQALQSVLSALVESCPFPDAMRQWDAPGRPGTTGHGRCDAAGFREAHRENRGDRGPVVRVSARSPEEPGRADNAWCETRIDRGVRRLVEGHVLSD